MGRALGCVVAAPALLLSCGGWSGRSGGGAMPADPAAPVPIGQWCASVGKTLCEELGGRCGLGSGAACEQGFAPACIAQRDPGAPSQRAQSDLAACGAHLRTLSCADLPSPTQLIPCQLPVGAL